MFILYMYHKVHKIKYMHNTNQDKCTNNKHIYIIIKETHRAILCLYHIYLRRTQEIRGPLAGFTVLSHPGTPRRRFLHRPIPIPTEIRRRQSAPPLLMITPKPPNTSSPITPRATTHPREAHAAFRTLQCRGTQHLAPNLIRQPQREPLAILTRLHHHRVTVTVDRRQQ